MKTIENIVYEAALVSKLVTPEECEGKFIASEELLERLKTMSNINANNLNINEYDSATVNDIWKDYLAFIEFKSHLARGCLYVLKNKNAKPPHARTPQ